jgi:hypothetical protein
MREFWKLRGSNGDADSSRGDELGSVLAIGVLCCLWLGLVTFGWARWGSVTVDSGREIYVAAALAQGKVLYRDVWYPYNPGAPYVNAELFRIFGTHITVAYLAGALAALGAALTLLRGALYLLPLPAAFAIAYIVLIQSFGPGIFSYPLPYSYAAVYGSVAACCFLLCAIQAAFVGTKRAVFWAAIWSVVALLMKLEHGLACFGTLALLQIGLILRQRSWRAALANLWVTVPALLVCAITIAWMVSIGGVTFLTQENFTLWPNSYFTRTYGQFWLGGMGFEWSLQKILSAIVVTVGFVIFWTSFRVWLRFAVRKLSFHNAVLTFPLAAVAVAIWTAYPEGRNDLIANLIFPPPMAFMVALAVPVAAFSFWRSTWQGRNLAILVLMTLSPLLGFRILFGMMPHAHAIFYNGPLLLAFFWLLLFIAIPANDADSEAKVRKAILSICALLCIWVTVQVYPDYRDMRQRRLPFESERGTIYLPETMLPAWAEAVDFMRHAKASGHTVMSIPEDTALYFFSDVLCPIRVCIFHPGVVAPGHMMNQVIGEIRQAQVQYIIWSNRKFYEYGAPEFGVDFDRPLGEYIRSKYRPVRDFGSKEPPEGWHAILWERK